MPQRPLGLPLENAHMLRNEGSGVKREPSARAGLTYKIGASTAAADGFDEKREWVRGFWAGLKSYFTAVYVNFLVEEGEDQVRQAYGSEKYDRLRA